MAIEDLRNDAMMSHLLDSLEAGRDIGHYGRLVFAMVARHFLTDEEVIDYLQKSEGCDEKMAHSLLQQVNSRDYNPPKKERILEWMQKQEFPICPNPDDPDFCNVYKDLQFPNRTYEKISEYHEKKAEN